MAQRKGAASAGGGLPGKALPKKSFLGKLLPRAQAGKGIPGKRYGPG